MKYIKMKLEKFENLSANWMNANGLLLLRLSIGIVFLWFGTLKFFPGLSPAQDLAVKTIGTLTFHLIHPALIINGLAIWEVIIGAGFLLGKYMKPILLLLFAQMAGTFTPVFLFPQEVFTAIPYAPTLEGQYIIKNIVIISAGLVIGAKVFISSKKYNASNMDLLNHRSVA